jgi:hypothetical protein
MTWLLRPGLRLVRRDADHLQLGVDPPRLAVLPDTRAVRRLLADLAHGGPLTTLDESTTPVLSELVRAGLVVAADDEAARHADRARCVVHVDAPADVLAAALRLVGETGLTTTSHGTAATVALVWSEGELARDRLDGWVRAGTPHLVVAELSEGPRLGPYVVPGVTACLRCVDAHAGEADPRRALVVEQVATGRPLRQARPDLALRTLSLAWAVRDLATAAEGGRPSTWSATVRLDTLPPVHTAYRRHLHCGCAWADAVTGDAAGGSNGAARAG